MSDNYLTVIERVGSLLDVIVMYGLFFPDGLSFPPCDLDVMSLGGSIT